MTVNEALTIAALAVCGAIFGVVSALATRRREQPIIDTLIWTVLGAPFITGAVVFVGGFFASIERRGFNPGLAILGGMATCAFGIGIHFKFGVSAVLAGLATQGILYCVTLRK